MEPIRRHRAGARSPPAALGRSPPPDGARSVYPPREDTLLLAKFARVPRGSTLLEIGTGSGEAALIAAHRGARVVATDLNPHALLQLAARARADGVVLSLVRTDLARGLGRFDRVLANPPYLPTRPAERDPDRWHNIALDGGPDGCRVTARLVRELPDHLLPGGEAFVVVSSLQRSSGLDRIRSRWTRQGGVIEVADSRDLEGETLFAWRLARGGP